MTSPAESPRTAILPPPGTLLLFVITLLVVMAQHLWTEYPIGPALGVRVANILSLAGLANVNHGQWVPGWLTLFTHTFPHGGFWHAIPNLTALWVFGTIVERDLGWRRLVGGYLLAGAAAVYCRALVPPFRPGVEAGASLAISGLMGGYLAWWWHRRLVSRRLRLLTLGVEATLVAVIAGWLVWRIVPEEPDRLCSLMYHVLPLLGCWLAMRVGLHLPWPKRIASQPRIP